MKRIWNAIVKFIDDADAEFAQYERRRIEADAAVHGGTVTWGEPPRGVQPPTLRPPEDLQ